MEPSNTVIDRRLDPRLFARSLYWQGWRISAISQHLSIKPATIYSWKMRENWDGGTPIMRVLSSIEARLSQLIMLPIKSDREFKEISQLYGLIERGQRDKRAGHREDESSPALANSNHHQRKRSARRKPDKNFFGDEEKKRLNEIFFECLFDYQKKQWIERHQRSRNLLKSRQIGATFYYAREALNNALNYDGHNKIFLSASRAQAHQFKSYMVNFADQVGVHLEGEVIRLQGGQELHFLGTNSRTAQGRHGDLYIDEYFWIPKFAELKDLARPMMSQKQFKATWFSTPSIKSHEAYPFWTGEEYNEGRPNEERITIDVSHQALQGGRLGGDGNWRQIITIEDALAGGCNLFELEYLRREYSPEKFRQLFLCEFIDDNQAVFPLEILQQCKVDCWEAWSDFYKPFAARPLGNAPVWVSYDPTDSGDAAGLVVIMPPQRAGGKFLVIESKRLMGNNYQAQAGIIQSYLSSYNVSKIVIDATGLGSAVYQLVQGFYPGVIGLRYTPDLKAMMVLKMQQVLRGKRMEFDAGNNDLVISFMGIRRASTAKSNQLTYVAGRSVEAGHSDVAWATMQAVMQEPLDESINHKSSLEIL